MAGMFHGAAALVITLLMINVISFSNFGRNVIDELETMGPIAITGALITIITGIVALVNYLYKRAKRQREEAENRSE